MKLSAQKLPGEFDILARVRFFATSEGERKSPTNPVSYRCPVEIQGEHFDCFIWLEPVGSVAPGQTVTVPIIFIRPDFVRPLCKAGSKFNLWEGRRIAEGTVNEILPDRKRPTGAAGV